MNTMPLCAVLKCLAMDLKVLCMASSFFLSRWSISSSIAFLPLSCSSLRLHPRAGCKEVLPLVREGAELVQCLLVDVREPHQD